MKWDPQLAPAHVIAKNSRIFEDFPYLRLLTILEESIRDAE